MANDGGTPAPAPAPAAAASTGENTGLTRTQRRNQRRKEAKAKAKKVEEPPPFKGEEPEMRGKVLFTPEEYNNPAQFRDFIEGLESYAARKLSGSASVMSVLFNNFEKPEYKEPDVLSDEEAKNAAQLRKYTSDRERMMNAQAKLEGDLVNLYTTMWGQMSQPLKTKLEAKPGYKKAKTEYDCAWLLKEAKAVCTSLEAKEYVFLSAYKAMEVLIQTKQGEDQLTDYSKRFGEVQKAIQYQGLELFRGKAVADFVVKHDGVNATDKDAIKEAVMDRGFAIAFLKGLNPKKHPDLIHTISNLSLFDEQSGTSNGKHQKYPKTPADSLDLALKYKEKSDKSTKEPTKKKTEEDEEPPPQRLNLIHRAVPGTDGITHGEVLCHKCKTKGHYAPACPRNVGEAFTLLHFHLGTWPL